MLMQKDKTMSPLQSEAAVEVREVSPIIKPESARIIHLPKIEDQRGNLTFIEGNRHVPFEIRRVYYLYDVPAGATRGGHAHKTLQQFVIAASGSFTVVVDDGKKKRRFFLNRPHYGLYIPRMVWRELENFSSGSICVALASEEYDESDYYRDYKEFKAALKKEHSSSLSRSARRVPGAQTGNRRGGIPGSR
jgi:dTDP-4-dehydrorhamnose 3,5-epimerase-like enzyme